MAEPTIQDPTDDNTRNLQPDWGKFIDGINKLNENVTDLKQGLTHIPDEPPKDAPKEKLELPDFDNMSQKEMANWLIHHFGTAVAKTILDQVTEAVKPALERQDRIEQKVLQTEYDQQVEQAATQHKDFHDWIDEMLAIVEETPGISATRAYNLARSENPKKAKELDTKYNPPPAPAPKPFSFTPGGSGSDSGGDKATRHPDGVSAFKAAYAKTAAKFPGVLPPLE